MERTVTVPHKSMIGLDGFSVYHQEIGPNGGSRTGCHPSPVIGAHEDRVDTRQFEKA